MPRTQTYHIAIILTLYCFYTSITFGQNKDYQKADTTKYIYHLIQKGETLSSIAQEYLTTEEKLQKLNNFKNG